MGGNRQPSFSPGMMLECCWADPVPVIGVKVVHNALTDHGWLERIVVLDFLTNLFLIKSARTFSDMALIQH